MSRTLQLMFTVGMLLTAVASAAAGPDHKLYRTLAHRTRFQDQTSKPTSDLHFDATPPRHVKGLLRPVLLSTSSTGAASGSGSDSNSGIWGWWFTFQNAPYFIPVIVISGVVILSAIAGLVYYCKSLRPAAAQAAQQILDPSAQAAQSAQQAVTQNLTQNLTQDAQSAQQNLAQDLEQATQTAASGLVAATKGGAKCGCTGAKCACTGAKAATKCSCGNAKCSCGNAKCSCGGAKAKCACTGAKSGKCACTGAKDAAACPPSTSSGVAGVFAPLGRALNSLEMYASRVLTATTAIDSGVQTASQDAQIAINALV